MYLTIRLKDDPNGKGVKSAITDANTFIRRRWDFMIYLIVLYI